MAEVRWTSQAADDLESVAEFIASESPHYARLFVMDVLNVVERLGASPRSGRVVPELGKPSIREVLLGLYRIVYRLRTGIVEMLAIWPGARLLDPRRICRSGD